MPKNKLFNVLVLGALTLGGCGTGTEPADDSTPDAAVAETSPDAGTLVADAGDTTVDAGSDSTDAGEGGGACMWAGMDPCPC